MSENHQVTLVQEGIQVIRFSCPDNLSIFRGAARAGIEMSAGCMQGRCQICRAILLEGSVKSRRPLSPNGTVDPANLPDGYVLPCSVVATSDVVIAPRGPWRLTDANGKFEMLSPDAMPVWD